MTNRRSILRLPILALGLLTLTGCSLIPSGWLPFDRSELPSLSFASPDVYTVQRGDTLSKIATRYGVTVADLQSWNDLEGDLIEVDQILMIWKPSSGGGLAALLGRAPAPGLVPGTPGRAPRSGAPARAAGTSEPATGGAQPGPGPGPEPEPGPGRRIAIRRPTLSGVLGLDLGGADLEALAQSAAGLEHRTLELGGDGLASRSGGLGTGGTIETIGAPDRAFRVAEGPSIPSTPVTPPRLARPPARRCLSGPRDVSGDADMAASQGLSVAQINAGMSRISQQAVRCFPRGTAGSYTALAEVVVGCNGRVTSVDVTAPALPDQVVSCLEQTLGYAGFPAHALPDGVVFQSPLKFTF